MTASSFLWLKLSILLCIPCIADCQQSGKNEGIIFHYNNTYKYDVVYTLYVNKNVEYVMEFAGDEQSYDVPARVTVASDFANKTYPLFITARQQKGISSWQLPMLVQTPGSMEQFTNMSRTLCPHNNLFDESHDTCDISPHNAPILQLTTSSPDDILVTVTVSSVLKFYVKLNSSIEVRSSPSQPQYFLYPFSQPPDLTSQAVKRRVACGADASEQLFLFPPRVESRLWRPETVILMIESDDDICAVVSIQNFSCPVFDNERDILYDGYYLTMTRRGGITLTQDQFPLGFYIVFIVKSSDEDCTATAGLNSNSTIKGDLRVKNFTFTIVSTISYQEYMIAAGAALAVFVSFYVLFVIVVIVQRADRTMVVPVNVAVEDAQPLAREDSGEDTHRRRLINTITTMDASVESTSRQQIGDAIVQPVTECSSSSDSESDYSTLDDINTEKDIYRLPVRLCVANLARKRARVISARSKMYLWNVLTVTVFYTLPVIQLVITYQRLLNQSGNQDLCYFNFLCAHPLLALSDFNHVYSNLGYVLLGALFMMQVWRRHREPAEQDLGIPQHFGLLYAMGIALVSEGLLSAAYHVCPNSMNFQFDTSFMYVTGVLCMVKVYQARHPDINARAHATFGVLALIIFIGLVGVLNANLYFWVAFTILHLTTCLVMTFQIYYMGRFKLDCSVIYRGARSLLTRPLSAMTPTYLGRCVMLLIANVANWSLAAYGVAQHSRDFASHLLLVLMSNLFLYTLFYIVMKLLNKEHILWYSWVFIALTYTTWFTSSYFYLDQSTNWALTPAESRRNNRVCSILQLYDSHDVWHFMSSIAMFFSFNMYLTIDDNLLNVPRNNIMVF